MKVCEQNSRYIAFRFTTTLDIPPQIAVNKQWRHAGDLLYHQFQLLCVPATAQCNTMLQYTTMHTLHFSLCSKPSDHPNK